MPELDPITGPEPSTLTPSLLAERLAAERSSRIAFDEAHAAVHQTEAIAREKAEASVAQRLEAMNEFREQLRNQAATFLTKDVFEARWSDYLRRHEELRELISDLQKADLGTDARRAGLARGQGMVIAAIIGSITVASIILGLILSVANILTGG